MNSTPAKPRSNGRTFAVLSAVGVTVMAYGIVGLVRNAVVTTPIATAHRLGTSVLVNDLLLIPLLMAVGALTTVLPPRLRPAIRAAMIVSGIVILFGVWGSVGQDRDVQLGNPTVLPNNYVSSVLIILGPVWVLAAAVTLVTALRTRSAAGHSR